MYYVRTAMTNRKGEHHVKTISQRKKSHHIY